MFQAAYSKLALLTALIRPDRLGGQTIIAFCLKIVSAVASFVLSLIIARTFGAAGSGLFGIAVTTVTILSYLVLVGLDYTLIRLVAGDLREGHKGSARGVVAAAVRGVLIVTPLVLGIAWVSRQAVSNSLFNQPAVTTLLGIMLLGVAPLALQRIASAALRASGRVISSQIVDGPLGTSLAVLGFSGSAWVFGASSLIIPAYFYVGGLLIGAGTGWLIYLFTVRDWPRAVPTALLPMLAAGLPLVAVSLSNAFTEWYTTVSLGRSWPAEIVGQYRAAWQFVAIAGLVQVSMEMMVGPRIAAAARLGGKQEIATIARKSILLSLVIGAPLLLIFVLFPSFLLGIFGEEFKGGALALQILAVGQLLRLCGGPLGSILIMTGHQRWMLGYAAAGVVLCIAFVAVFVPLYGAVGAALATGATILLRTLAAGFIVRQVLKIHVFRRSNATDCPH